MRAKKKKLSEIAAEEISERIAKGEWASRLPNEHGLADALQISRRVTREALQILEKSGVISPPVRGKRRAVLTIPPPSKQLSVAIFFMPFSLDTDLSSWLTIKEISNELAASKVNVITPDYNLSQSDLSTEKIAALFESCNVDAWILLRPARVVVEFAIKNKIPVFCLGGDIVGLPVSSIVDNRIQALYQGTKRLLELGHSRIIVPFRRDRHPKRGLNQMQAAMEQAFIEHDIVWSQQYHAPYWSGTTKSYCTMLAEQFKVTRPTAFILGSYSELMPLLSYMNFMKLRIGEDISIIINQKHPELEHILPGIDTYEIDESKIVIKTSSRTIDLALGIDNIGQELLDMKLHERHSVQAPPQPPQ